MNIEYTMIHTGVIYKLWILHCKFIDVNIVNYSPVYNSVEKAFI